MEFRGEYAFLSNFYQVPIFSISKGIKFDSVERAYQWTKCVTDKDRNLILNSDLKDIKKLSRQIEIRNDWEAIKVQVMTTLVRQKFMAGTALANKLASIQEHIEEENTWGDTFWGVCGTTGLNQLGLILMNVRRLNQVVTSRVFKNDNTGDSVYIGRLNGGKWGNPFKLHIDTEEERRKVLCQYRHWLKSQPDLVEDMKSQLMGHNLSCHCAPKVCHGHVIVEIVH